VVENLFESAKHSDRRHISGGEPVGPAIVRHFGEAAGEIKAEADNKLLTRNPEKVSGEGGATGAARVCGQSVHEDSGQHPADDKEHPLTVRRQLRRGAVFDRSDAGRAAA